MVGTEVRRLIPVGSGREWTIRLLYPLLYGDPFRRVGQCASVDVS
jgi:hypothetical protein